MKFLVVTMGTHPAPPEAMPAMIEGMRGWIERYSPKMDALWGFAGQPGGCGIVNIDSADELDEIMASFPFAQHSQIQVYPLCDLTNSLNRFSEMMQQMQAG